jgi:hypothetical protein
MKDKKLYDKNYFQIFSKKFKIFSKNLKYFQKNFWKKLDSVKGFENTAFHPSKKCINYFFKNKKRTVKIIFRESLESSKS